jgi:ribosomal-protein-alanine N-acetyltransferase
VRIVLETPRLALREMTPGDLDFVAEMLAHPEVTRYYSKRYSRADAEQWLQRQIRRYVSHGYGLWLVEEKATGSPVGQVGLVPQIVGGVEEPEIGYLIHHPYWRRGLATESALAVRDYTFGVLGRDHVIALIRPENVPSQGVARKLGMTPGPRMMHVGMEHIIFSVAREKKEEF